MAQPGALTREFVEGRRARYISPIRIYLLASALFFFLLLTFGREIGLVKVGSGSRVPRGGVRVTTPANVDDRLERGARELERKPDELRREISQALGKAMFLLMPLFAALLLLFYRKQQRYYVPHLYFSVHYHAFSFLLLSCVSLLLATKVAALAMVGSVLQLGLMVYLVLALRRVYGGTTAVTLAKTAGIVASYLVMLIATMAGIVMYSLYRAG